MSAKPTTYTQTTRIALAAAVLLCLLSSRNYAGENNFNPSMILIGTSLAIYEQQGLSFGNQLIPSTDTDLIVAPANAKAAFFNATGEPNLAVTASIVERKISLSNGLSGKKNKMDVTDFTLGGSVDASGNGSFNAQGLLDNIRVGATATISSTNNLGAYQGTATLRVVYN
ncbi:MAG: hypothetical protein COB04_05535 [Gammaproteobacteria bacterium]|nr:MAG: hypothetical protein COB04_05535 [Gammaproteobacteria bacterium]